MFADVDGEYPGGDGRPHTATNFAKRTVFSGRDVYRSEFPLLTIIAPGIVNDMINSFVELADQNGTRYYDRWELFNAYTGCMNGNPAVVVINDAFQKGIRNYDSGRAYEYARNMIKSPSGWTGNTRRAAPSPFARAKTRRGTCTSSRPR